MVLTTENITHLDRDAYIGGFRQTLGFGVSYVLEFRESYTSPADTVIFLQDRESVKNLQVALDRMLESE